MFVSVKLFTDSAICFVVINVVILQGKEFWLRYLLTYRSFSSHHDFIGRTAPTLPHFIELVDWIFIRLHEIFVDGMYLKRILLIIILLKLCEFASCGCVPCIFCNTSELVLHYSHLMALFQDNLSKPVSERQNHSGF